MKPNHANLVYLSRVSLEEHSAATVQSSQLCGAGQCKKCVQYDFKFTSEYSAMVNANYCSIPFSEIKRILAKLIFKLIIFRNAFSFQNKVIRNFF